MHVIKLYYKNHLKSEGYFQIFLRYSLFAWCVLRKKDRKRERERERDKQTYRKIQRYRDRQQKRESEKE